MIGAKVDAQLVAVAAVALVGLYWLGKREVVGVVGGAVSGNNALTANTPYAGAGIVGTVGAATNAASGGVLQSIGERLGIWTYDFFHPKPATQLPNLWDKLTAGTH